MSKLFKVLILGITLASCTQVQTASFCRTMLQIGALNYVVSNGVDYISEYRLVHDMSSDLDSSPEVTLSLRSQEKLNELLRKRIGDKRKVSVKYRSDKGRWPVAPAGVHNGPTQSFLLLSPSLVGQMNDAVLPKEKLGTQYRRNFFNGKNSFDALDNRDFDSLGFVDETLNHELTHIEKQHKFGGDPLDRTIIATGIVPVLARGIVPLNVMVLVGSVAYAVARCRKLEMEAQLSVSNNPRTLDRLARYNESWHETQRSWANPYVKKLWNYCPNIAEVITSWDWSHPTCLQHSHEFKKRAAELRAEKIKNELNKGGNNV